MFSKQQHLQDQGAVPSPSRELQRSVKSDEAAPRPRRMALTPIENHMNVQPSPRSAIVSKRQHPQEQGAIASTSSEGHEEAPSRQKKCKRTEDAGAVGRRSDTQSEGNGEAKDYVLDITAKMSALHIDTSSSEPASLKKILQKYGAAVEIDTKIGQAKIHGNSTQIQKTIKLFRKKMNYKGPASEQDFWIQWVQETFPDFHSGPCFLPPLYFSRVPTTRHSFAGHPLSVLWPASDQAGQPDQSVKIPRTVPQPPKVQDSDVKDDEAMNRVLTSLKNMFQQKKEILVLMSNLHFKDYLAERSSTANRDQPYIPRKKREIDMLLIHRDYGFFVFEVKAVGDKVFKLNKSTKDAIKLRLVKAVEQLNCATDNLKDASCDIAPNIRVRKTIILPNLTASQVQATILGDQELLKCLCECLETESSSPEDIASLCLCSDQLSDQKNLEEWWKRSVAGAGTDNQMTHLGYTVLTARFCGPATTVTVPCTSSPRVSVKTLGQAVKCTGVCYSEIGLFPEQTNLLSTRPPRLFVTGPPGTGKTVVLLLMATEWLHRREKVYIVSTWKKSLPVCIMLKHHLSHYTVVEDQLNLLLYDFEKKEMSKAVNELSQLAKGGILYVIADEAGPDKSGKEGGFKTFCKMLLKKVPQIHLWAASCYNRHVPNGWEEQGFNRPLRSPPVVRREVEKDRAFTRDRSVKEYGDRGVPDFTDGPAVKRISHKNHSYRPAINCVECGDMLVSFLQKDLRVGVPVLTKSEEAASYDLMWRDVLVVYKTTVSDKLGIVKAMRKAKIPLRLVMDDMEGITDMATAKDDVVWVTHDDLIRGLERKVVVCVEVFDKWSKKAKFAGYKRLHSQSRCTGQLVIVCN
ncbi:uncharacterized protein LOC112576146 isoform X2 [Pomacea canaliculata]|uniref:uncharacterized protein LOC112576146 isoform X2 n=1 Tax=Pomacea canaliculata TaxID=400727 RepID=UPI000D727F00|nr:uncharacterized protein LOC112576146 isoform X2 [Pomacea canaliculata]